jgi:hypothetical protein
MGEEQPKEEKETKATPTKKKKEPKKNTGLTISSTNETNTGATISTYDGGETGKKDTSQIYKDPNTGSTIATKAARTNIAQGGDYQIVASTSTPAPAKPYDPASMTSYVPAGDVLYQKKKEPVTAVSQTGHTHFDSPSDAKKDLGIVQQQKKLISEPRPSEDLVTGEPLKYRGPGQTTAINKLSPALRRAMLGSGSSVFRRMFGL